MYLVLNVKSEKFFFHHVSFAKSQPGINISGEKSLVVAKFRPFFRRTLIASRDRQFRETPQRAKKELLIRRITTRRVAFSFGFDHCEANDE